MQRRETLFGSALLHDLLPPPVVGYVFLAATLDLVRAYRHWPNLDVPMHYVGAVVLAYVIHRGVRHAARRGLAVPMDGWLHGLFVFALVCTTSMFWEIAEFASDRLLGTHAQLSLADTMSDMLLDAIGAATFLLVLWVLRRRYPARRHLHPGVDKGTTRPLGSPRLEAVQRKARLSVASDRPRPR